MEIGEFQEFSQNGKFSFNERLIIKVDGGSLYNRASKKKRKQKAKP